MGRFEALRRAGAGTEFEKKAGDEIERIGLREKGVQDALARLKGDAEAHFEQGRMDEAISRVRDYAGPFCKETSETRETLAASYERKAAQIREAEAGQMAASKAKVTALLNGVADDLLKSDFESARSRIAEVEKDDSFRADLTDWKEVRGLTAGVLAMPAVILGSFKKDVGKEITVELKEGPERLQIADVGSEEVKAKKVVQREGRVVGSSVRPFRVEDLSVNEKFRRLGKANTAEVEIMRGLLAWEGKKCETAAKYFEQSACRLGEILKHDVDEWVVEQASAAERERKAVNEAAAEKAYQALLKTVCPELVGREGGSAWEEDLATLKEAVEGKRLGQIQVNRIRQLLAAFRQDHEKTDFAGVHAPVLEALSQIEPDSLVFRATDGKETGTASPSGRKTKIRKMSERELRKFLDEAGVKYNALGTGDQGGIYQLDLQRTGIDDLSPLKGLPLAHVDLWDTGVSDLSPLQGMPLNRLILRNTRVTDLSPLKGLPLAYLDLHETEVSDLSPLQGMPIKVLFLHNTRVSDLSPLKGMQVRTLIFIGSSVSDLSPLKGMPLGEIAFDLNIVTNGIEVIRKMKSLRKINSVPAEDFWKAYDAGEFR